jgi:hypothetical protein
VSDTTLAIEFDEDAALGRALSRGHPWRHASSFTLLGHTAADVLVRAQRTPFVACRERRAANRDTFAAELRPGSAASQDSVFNARNATVSRRAPNAERRCAHLLSPHRSASLYQCGPAAGARRAIAESR